MKNKPFGQWSGAVVEGALRFANNACATIRINNIILVSLIKRDKIFKKKTCLRVITRAR
jgi:hypothetical protein